MNGIAGMFRRCKRATMCCGFRVEYEDARGNHGQYILHFSYDDLCDDQGRILLGIMIHRKRGSGVICGCVRSMVGAFLDMPSFSSQKDDGVKGITFIFFDPVRGTTSNDEGHIMLRNGIDVIRHRVVVVFPLNKHA